MRNSLRNCLGSLVVMGAMALTTPAYSANPHSLEPPVKSDIVARIEETTREMTNIIRTDYTGREEMVAASERLSELFAEKYSLGISPEYQKYTDDVRQHREAIDEARELEREKIRREDKIAIAIGLGAQ
jgi:hypothetical protein